MPQNTRTTKSNSKDLFTTPDNGNGAKGNGHSHNSEVEAIPGVTTISPDQRAVLDTLPDPILSENAITVLERRYLIKDGNGKVTENPKEMFWRVATTIAQADLLFDNTLKLEDRASLYYNMMAKLDFVPNSPTMMNAGRRLGQLSACFVLPVEDSMDGIFETVKHAALVHKSGGGTGFSFSRLRPKSSMVQSTAGTASGPVSFMTVFNAATETIKQGGTRRGANMGILRVDHPDIRDFIVCKQDMVSITNFNISVTVTDAFMKAVDKGTKYDMISPHSGKVVGQEDAREIFNLIADNAWHNGDPGLVFIDEVNRHEPTLHIGKVEATNPCGEQPLLPYESCNLGSINLDHMRTANNEIDWDKLRETVRLSTQFLDNIIEMNRYPVQQIHDMTHANRRIGLGIMGFADLLYSQGIPYSSEEAQKLGGKIMEFIQTEARQMSDEMAEIRGPFPNWEGSKFDHPTRNSTVTTIAPTGTISMIADTSGGVEPNFALVYVKRVMDDDRLLYVNKHFEDAAKAGGFYSKELMEKIANGAHIHDLDEIPEDAKKVFVTAHDITPENHILMQAAFQAHTENAVSKTINFPNSATIDDVKNAYLLAWSTKCKGITIYRDGSRPWQVMNVGKDKAKADPNEAPNEIAPKESAAPMNKTVEESKPVAKQPAAQHTRNRRSTDSFLKPRRRPSVTRGYTEHIGTGDGSLFVTINEDDDGLCEVFASIGRSGGNAAAQSEAIGRLISLALRSGIDPREIVKQLKGISGSNQVWHEGKLIRSTPDAIGQALERFLDNLERTQTELPFDAPSDSVAEKAAETANKPVLTSKTGSPQGPDAKLDCPDCHEGQLVYEEGCMKCHSCGYSKCG
ncbi:vitamin B12-dependent ribonucleotide reductase [Calditrichota bacterium]